MIKLKLKLKLFTVLFFGLISSIVAASSHTVALNTQTIYVEPDVYDATDGAIIEFEVLHSYDKTNNPTGSGPDTLGYLLHYDSTKIKYLGSDIIYTTNFIGTKIDELAEGPVTKDDESTTDRVLYGIWSSSGGAFQYTTPYIFTCVDSTTYETTNPFDPNICAGNGGSDGNIPGGGVTGDIPQQDFPLVRYRFEWISTSKTTTVTKVSLNLNSISDGKGYTSISFVPNTSTVATFNKLTISGPATTNTANFTIPENSTNVGDIPSEGTGGIFTIAGVDADLFEVSTAGVLAFKATSAPNFEVPQGGIDNNSNDYEVVVTMDSVSLSEITTVTVSITNVIEAPVLSGAPNLARVGSPYTFTPVVVNEEGQTLTYTNDITISSNDTGLGYAFPSGLSFNAQTGAISGTPAIAGTATVSITAEFTDSLSGLKYAGTLTITLTVEDKLDQTLAFSTTAVFKTFGDANFIEAVSGTSSTATTVYSSSTSTVATVAGDGMVTIVGAGSTTISATNAGDYHYNPISTSYALTVAKADQPNFAFASDATRTVTFEFGLQVPGIVATGALGAGTTVYSSNDHSVAVANSTNGNLAIQGAGEAIITATNPGDDNYNWASATYTITIEKAEQMGFAFPSDATRTVTFIDSALELTGIVATGTSGTGTTTYDSSDFGVAMVNMEDGDIIIQGAGSAIITATNPGDNNYNEAVATYTITVEKAEQTGFAFTLPGPIETTAGDPAVTNEAIGGQGAGSVSYELSFIGTETVATIDAATGAVTPLAAGTATITATKAESNNYYAATTTYTLNIAQAFNLDIDGNASVSAGSDGLLAVKFMGFSDAAILDTSGILGIDPTRTDADILAYLKENMNLLDIDDNGSVSAGSDGLLIIKFMSFPDTNLLDTTGIIGVGANRSSEEILIYLKQLFNN